MYTLLVAVAIVVAAVSIALDRRIQARKTSGEAEDSGEKAQDANASETSDQGKSAWYKLFGKSQNDLPQQFKDWAVKDLKGEKALSDWIDGLSDRGLKALTEQLAAFCSDLNLELVWLVDGKLAEDPDGLKQVVEAVVVAYCSACWQAAQSQVGLGTFRTLMAIEQDPAHKKHRELSQKLYSELVKKNVVQAPPASELISFSEKEKQAQVAQAIQGAATANRATLYQTLKTVLIEDNDNQTEVSVSKSKTSTTEPEPAEQQPEQKLEEPAEPKASSENPAVAGATG